jgi:hypothetical protein
MKKLLFLVAFALLAGTAVSCDNMPDESVANQHYVTDDGFTPIKTPPPPPPPPGPTPGGITP